MLTMAAESQGLEIAAIVVSALAIIVSIVSNKWSRESAKAAGRSAAAAETSANSAAELVAIEHARIRGQVAASKRAHVEVGRVGFDKLQIRNVGRATATNVRVLVDGRSVDDCESLVHPTDGAIGDAILASGTSIVLYYAATNSSDVRFPARFETSWDDDSGERGQWASDVY